MCRVLDPIDGTKSFITGKPLFGTLIACLQWGVPIIGIIDQCVLKERWVGVVGRGTTFNGQPVTASTNTTNSSASSSSSKLKDVMMYATTPHMFHEGEERCKFNEMCTAVKRPLYGADCYAYAILASGFGAELVVEADLGLYDYCALVG
jgi:inositol-phosphate phosphatase/L-galactose 1-phosphate phosphatase/histidinol-phosphatase